MVKSNQPPQGYYQAPPPLPRRNDPAQMQLSRSSSVMSTASSGLSQTSHHNHGQPSQPDGRLQKPAGGPQYPSGGPQYPAGVPQHPAGGPQQPGGGLQQPLYQEPPPHQRSISRSKLNQHESQQPPPELPSTGPPLPTRNNMMAKEPSVSSRASVSSNAR